MPRLGTNRKDLINNLIEVFSANGFEGATMAQLSRATGLGKASLYHHFPGGKLEMLGAATRATIDDLDRHVFRHLESRREPSERIIRMLEGFDRYVESGAKNCLLAIIAQGRAAGDYGPGVSEQFKVWLSQLEVTLKATGFGNKRARRTARQTFATLYGAIVLGRLMRDAETYQALVKRLRKDLLLTQS